MGLHAQPAGHPHHLEAPAPVPAGGDELVAEGLDLFGRHLEELGQHADGHRLDGGDEHGLDGPGLGRRAPSQPSYSSRSEPGDAGTGTARRPPSRRRARRRSHPGRSSTRPCLHSSSRARKRTMISMRARRCPVSSRKVTSPGAGQPDDELGHGVGHGHRVHRHVVEVHGGRRPLGRGPAEGARPGRPAVTPASRSGPRPARSSSRPAVRGTARAARSMRALKASAAAA